MRELIIPRVCAARTRTRWAWVFALAAALLLDAAWAKEKTAEPVAPAPKRASVPTLPPNGVWLDEIPLQHYEESVHTPLPKQSVYEKPLTVAGTIYPRGIGTHSLFEWMLDVGGEAESLEVWIGLDDETENRGSAVFEIWADEKCAFRSGVIYCGEPVRRISADLRGAHKILLATRTGGDGMGFDHGDWCNAYFVMKPGATTKPTPIPIKFDETPMPIAAIDKKELGIFGPRVVGATPGKPFLFRIPASGEGTLSFRAKGLPKGLTLDRETGIISGAIAQEGTSMAGLTVKDAHGKFSRDLKIIAGRNVLAQTPPMGWNSWNAWFTVPIDDAKIRDAADAMASSGLAAKGYQYVNMDDGWAGQRDAEGMIHSNARFPDMKALADHIHALGLKCGSYSSPGPKTCMGLEGSYQHETQDAARYAAWGFDYLKYDWCSCMDLYGFPAPLAVLQGPYRSMGKALLDGPRDIVFSMGQGGMGAPWLWGRDLGANLWRTTTDVCDKWGVILTFAMAQLPIGAYAGPGSWNDPDMLVVGVISWGTAQQHPTGLRPNEQISHLTMWSMLAAPLILGCDLTKLDDFTFSLAANPEVIDVDQDPLGKSAQRAHGDGCSFDVWTRPLFDGTQAVALLNLQPWKQTITITPEMLKTAKGAPVRDLWRRCDLAPLNGELHFDVAPRGAILLKVGAPK